LELEFKKKQKGKIVWTTEFGKFVGKFEEKFRSIRKDKKLVNYIHELRDRCSHIKIGKDILGVTQLSNKDMLEIYRFFPLMTKICHSRINEKYHNKGFSLVDYKTFSQKTQELTKSDE